VNKYLRTPVFWGLVVGAINAGAPLAFWWLEPATALALALPLIAAVYIGFAVADGRPKIIVTEILVVSVFVVIAATGITATAWLLVIGYAAHGFKDAWQERTHFVANTRWWPPFCATVDFLVAIVLIIEIAAGVDFHA
jgi:hypothetical protein